MAVVRNGREEEEETSMEWDKQEDGVLFVKVMTDEQMEILRKQISVYATICEQLVEMHKSITAQQDSLAGMRLGNLYCDPLMASGGQKITARQRWTPTPVQLRILESIFDEGNGTPSKQKIKEITSQLTHHGQISETNVYNWFQNRRARSKRKQPAGPPNNGDSEVETDVDSPKEKRAKSENIQSLENPAPKSDDLCFQSSDISSQLHSLDPPQPNKAQSTLALNENSRSSSGLGHISFYENVLSNPRIDHLMGKMEGNFNHFRTEGYEI